MLASPSHTIPTANLVPKITRGHSCVLCQQRKVRCDRQKPKCSNCLKARAECIANPPSLPRRKRTKPIETDLTVRLKRYEQLLKTHGIKIEDDEEVDIPEKEDIHDEERASIMQVPRAPDAEKGALFTNKENSHYVENTLWENLREEISDPKDALQHTLSSDDEAEEAPVYPYAESFLVGHGYASKNLTALHPQPIHIFQLWQTFLVNVNPLVKMFHAPTVQQIILDASLASRTYYDVHSTWVLTGAVVRIAQRLGLHRDGSRYKISVFEAEMRRRTWWQVVFLDGHASKLAGSGFPAWLAKFDTRIPLNLSDSDLSPAMKEEPKDKEGATEMIFCCLRYEVAQAIRKGGAFVREGLDAAWHIPTGIERVAEKDKAIDDLEKRFEERYVRYCDPSIPLHLIVIYVAQSVICSMRIMAHHPRQYPDKGANMPQNERDMLFKESLKELEIDSMGHSIKAVQGYVWHIQHYFQLDAFIYILSELRYRLRGDLVERAWEQVSAAFEYHTEMITNTKNALYFAIGNLTLKAWAKREEAGLTNQGIFQVNSPKYISLLRAQRNIPDTQRPTEIRNSESYVRSNHIPDNNSTTLPPNNIYQKVNDQAAQFVEVDLGFEMEMSEVTPNDWEYWQTLMDLPAFNEEGLFNQFNA